MTEATPFQVAITIRSTAIRYPVMAAAKVGPMGDMLEIGALVAIIIANRVFKLLNAEITWMLRWRRLIGGGYARSILKVRYG
jgi:hypothetical protein